jgi:hypothetical protein
MSDPNEHKEETEISDTNNGTGASAPGTPEPEPKPWRPDATIGKYGKYGQAPYDSFAHGLAAAGGRAVNKGWSAESVWRQGWRDELKKAPLHNGFEERFGNPSEAPAPIEAPHHQDRGQDHHQNQNVLKTYFNTTFANAGELQGGFIQSTRPDAQIKLPHPSSSTLRPSTFGGQGRSLSELPIKVQENIQTLGTVYQTRRLETIHASRQR